jgi:predicted nucleic acid-binding protein
LRILFDAGSLINLSQGKLLPILASTSSYKGHVGPIVRSECKTIAAQIDHLISDGTLLALPDVALSAASFGILLNRLNLGLGETECIAFGLQDQFVISCDDAAARRVIEDQLGSKRLTGTLGLLVLGVRDCIVKQHDAFASYQQMRTLGGFLPDLSKREFHNLVHAGP